MADPKPATLRVDKLDDLYGNPQRMSVPQKNALLRAIARDGFLVPVLVRRVGRSQRYEVLSGNHRVDAARTLGIDKVPAMVVPSDWTDEKAARVAVDLNTIHGNPDPQALAEFVPAGQVDEVYVEPDLRAVLARIDDTWRDAVPEWQARAVDIVPAVEHPTRLGVLSHVLLTVPLDRLDEVADRVRELDLGDDVEIVVSRGT